MNKAIAAQLVENHREELLRFITRRVSCHETAFDILQDCFLRLASYMDEKTVQNPRAFLFKMAANQATDHLRHQKRFAECETDIAELPELIDPTPSVEDIISGTQRLEKLKQALAELPPKYREVFILRNIRHLSYAEITEQTGLSYNTIFKYINETLLHCQKQLQD